MQVAGWIPAALLGREPGVVERVEGLQKRGIQAGIPATDQETSTEDLEGELDAATAVRAALAGALRDRLDPLIQDLLAVIAEP